MVRNTKDDDADNKLRKGGGVGGGFLSSLRRSGFLRVPAAALEEIRPMIGNGSSHASSGSSNNNTGLIGSGSSIASAVTTSKGIRSATPPTSSVTRLSASGNHHHHHHYPPYHASHQHDNFEISVRDKTDATAKRGFRVQVPKRMLLYTVLVFLGLPLVIFLYVELHLPSHTTTATSNQEQRVKLHAGGKHTVGLSDVLPHASELTGGADGDVAEVIDTDTKNTTSSTNEQGTAPSEEVEPRGTGLPETIDADKKAPDSPTMAKEQDTTGTALGEDESSKTESTAVDGKEPATTPRTRRKKGKAAKEPTEEGADDKDIDASATAIAKDGQPPAVVVAEAGGSAETAERVELENDAASQRGLQADPSLVVTDAAAVQRRAMLRRRAQR